MATNDGNMENETAKKIEHVNPIVHHSDMNEEMRKDTIELITEACKTYAPNYEHAAQVIKDTMDKKFGIYWHVVIGEKFWFEVTSETANILYITFNEKLAILLWKYS